MTKLQDRVAIVTGAGRPGNIGEAICAAFLDEGVAGVSEAGFKQRHFVRGQTEQRIDARVDLGFDPGDLGSQRVNLRAVFADPRPFSPKLNGLPAEPRVDAAPPF